MFTGYSKIGDIHATVLIVWGCCIMASLVHLSVVLIVVVVSLQVVAVACRSHRIVVCCLRGGGICCGEAVSVVAMEMVAVWRQ